MRLRGRAEIERLASEMESYYDKPFEEIPEYLQRETEEVLVAPWDKISPDQRRSAITQILVQRDDNRVFELAYDMEIQQQEMDDLTDKNRKFKLEGLKWSKDKTANGWRD